ncbi:DUF732 domain-containing protein [Mycolicibacterium neoaurum]|uniref:DUF732 domain-containing protein n=1 Tax=Mycolicibacterium neoaurum TaxID=1795 RepID=UPI002671F71E|nr:DUF732 domain-containing protein [Mycolicibacterium neoaurum]MDO3402718.1 DUF732 domain-containing protein [Mycolicibacterium neoaurum]
MKMRAVATFGCVTAGVTVALLGAPAASADDASFAREMKSIGFVQSTPNLVSTAKSACYSLWLNRPLYQVEERILRYTRVEPPLARQFFVTAVREFCPQYSGVVGPI